jgi:hypothetical protein
MDYVAQSERRVAVLAQRIRDRAAASVAGAPPILPPLRDESFPAEPGSGRLYGDRRVCRECSRNLKRYESEMEPCGFCQANPAPLVAEKAPAVDYLCGCKR